MSSNEIITLYKNYFSDIEKIFPIETEKLNSTHKSAINNIKEKLKINNLSSESQRQIDLEFNKPYLYIIRDKDILNTIYIISSIFSTHSI